MKNDLRLLETPDDQDPNELVRIITNDFNRRAQELSDLYRNRWQIEIFFKWIKQHLHVKVFYGFSQNAVKNQISFLKKEVQSNKSLFTVLRLFSICKYKTLEKFIKKLKRPPTRTSRGRRKINHEEIFNLTYRQVMAGDSELLYSTKIDPVVL